jgi:isoquinoline 1-oxidoreductase subunit beta
MTVSKDLTRRDFMRIGTAGGVALVIGFHVSSAGSEQQSAVPATSPFNAWIRIGSDGTVTLLSAKAEIGQGIQTALPMILADELGVDWSVVRVEQAPVNPGFYDHETGGSGSVFRSWEPMRRAGATAREMLIDAAAMEWGIPRAQCRAEVGVIVDLKSGRRATYGDLVKTAMRLPVPDPATVPLKNPADFRIIGTSAPRKDVPAKINGSAIFGIDVRVPDMLFAVIERSPTFGGSVKSFDATRAEAMPGVHKCVSIPSVGPGARTAGGVAVVADSTWQALKGREALKIEWEPGPHATESSDSLLAQFESLRGATGKRVRSDGDVSLALGAAVSVLEAQYELPFLAHATMEPMNCTADVKPDRAELWIPAQLPNWIHIVVGRLLNLPLDRVKLHMPYMGGGFGRRGHADFAIEAVQVSQAVGRPVQVVWTREDDIKHSFFRPLSYHLVRAGLDANGHVAAWHHRIFSTSIRRFWDRPERVKPEAQEISGAESIPYGIPNVAVDYSELTSAVPRAWWRSVDESANPFVVESFINELAAAANTDAVEYRLRMLQGSRLVPNAADPTGVPCSIARLRNVLTVAAEKGNWYRRAPRGRFRGIACHYSFYSYVAEIVEISISKDDEIRVHRVTCVIDCGRAINPSGIRAQMEGGIIFGLTAALHGEITVRDGAVEQSNFGDYPMLRMREAPEIDVHIIDSYERPTGTGEPGLPPVAAALVQAIHDATGLRVRRLPISRGLAAARATNK